MKFGDFRRNFGQEEEEERERRLQEQRSAGVHSSQQKIKVVGLDG